MLLKLSYSLFQTVLLALQVSNLQITLLEMVLVLLVPRNSNQRMNGVGLAMSEVALLVIYSLWVPVTCVRKENLDIFRNLQIVFPVYLGNIPVS